MDLNGERVRPPLCAAADVTVLIEMFAEPEVAKWWGDAPHQQPQLHPVPLVARSHQRA